MVMLNSLDKAIVRITQQGHRRLRRLWPEGAPAPLQIGGTSQERFDNSAALRLSSQVVVQTLPVRSSAQVEAPFSSLVSVSPSLPAGWPTRWSTSLRKSATSPSTDRQCWLQHRRWHAFVAGFAVLLFASGLAFYQRSFACQGPVTRHQYWRRAPGERSLARTHFQRSIGVWRRGQKLGLLSTLHRSSWEFVRGQASTNVSADDHCICDSFKHCDPTSPGGGLQ